MPRKMKESGVEWLGQIPDGWGVNLVFQVADQVKSKNEGLREQNLLSLSYGKIKRKSIETVGGLLPQSFDGYNIIEADDIVLRLTDLQNDQHSLRVGISSERGIITSAYTTLRPRTRETAQYLYYSLHAFDLVKGFYGMGSGVRQGLNYDEVKLIKLPRPSAADQQRIAAFLDERCAKIDGMIAEAKASIEDYKKWKQSIIFEAVTGKHEKNLKPSGVDWIGDVPEGWKVCKVLHALSMPITDGPHTTPELYDDGIPFVSAEAVSAGNGHIDFNHIRGYISEAFYRECSEKYVPALDDIYMIKSGATTGKVAIVDTDRIFTIWSPLAVFRSDKDKTHPKFLFYFLQSPIFQKQVELAWSFGTQQNIGMRMLEGLKIVLPPLLEQRRIAAELDEKCAAIDKLVGEKEALIADLEAYKKSLIFEAVTGKREVA